MVDAEHPRLSPRHLRLDRAVPRIDLLDATRGFRPAGHFPVGLHPMVPHSWLIHAHKECLVRCYPRETLLRHTALTYQGKVAVQKFMKRNGKTNLPAPVPSAPATVEPAAKVPGTQNGIVEEHRNLMTTGELIFHLRDVHRYWSTPRMSPREMEELAMERLIECSAGPICSIRLTEQGALMKNGKSPKAP